MLVMIECAWLYVIEFMPTYRFIAISMNKQHFVSISMITGLQHLLMFCFNLVLLEMFCSLFTLVLLVHVNNVIQTSFHYITIGAFLKSLIVYVPIDVWDGRERDGVQG